MIDDIKWTARDLSALLCKRHKSPEWSIFLELRNMPGFAVNGKTRSIDALAVHNWTPYERIAYEIKVNRSDWLKELDDLTKSQPFVEQCHEFTVVAAPGVVKKGEVPEGWGLIEPDKSEEGGLRRVVRAQRKVPKALSEDLCLCLVRASSMAPKSATAYRYQDREMTDVDLIRIASEVYERNLESEVTGRVRVEMVKAKNDVAHAVEEMRKAGSDAELGRAIRGMVEGISDWDVRREFARAIAYKEHEVILASLRTVKIRADSALKRLSERLEAIDVDNSRAAQVDSSTDDQPGPSE